MVPAPLRVRMWSTQLTIYLQMYHTVPFLWLQGISKEEFHNRIYINLYHHSLTPNQNHIILGCPIIMVFLQTEAQRFKASYLYEHIPYYGCIWYLNRLPWRYFEFILLQVDFFLWIWRVSIHLSRTKVENRWNSNHGKNHRS